MSIRFCGNGIDLHVIFITCKMYYASEKIIDTFYLFQCNFKLLNKRGSHCTHTKQKFTTRVHLLALKFIVLAFVHHISDMLNILFCILHWSFNQHTNNRPFQLSKTMNSISSLHFKLALLMITMTLLVTVNMIMIFTITTITLKMIPFFFEFSLVSGNTSCSQSVLK